MKHIRIFSLFLAAVFFASYLTGCHTGNPTQDGTQNGTGAPGTSVGSVKETEPSSTDGEGEKVLDLRNGERNQVRVTVEDIENWIAEAREACRNYDRIVGSVILQSYDESFTQRQPLVFRDEEICPDNSLHRNLEDRTVEATLSSEEVNTYLYHVTTVFMMIATNRCDSGIIFSEVGGEFEHGSGESYYYPYLIGLNHNEIPEDLLEIMQKEEYAQVFFYRDNAFYQNDGTPLPHHAMIRIHGTNSTTLFPDKALDDYTFNLIFS